MLSDILLEHEPTLNFQLHVFIRCYPSAGVSTESVYEDSMLYSYIVQNMITNSCLSFCSKGLHRQSFLYFLGFFS